jgi:eukaryotic-like serine/threonine-protein kinase
MSAEPTQRPPPASGNEPGLAQGARIGRYVVLGLLGRGGMGEVYAAYDPELDRKIAVKLLRARGHDPATPADGKTRLLREAQAIARLSHPNVVVVYDVGTFADSVFIAMEFVEGHTVGYWLAARPRKVKDVLDVFMAAGRGLVAAHTAGLVHRDFKPDNVMITKSGQVRVMDFGLARQQVRDDEPSLASQAVLDAQTRAAALAETVPPNVDPDVTAKLADVDGDAPPPSGSGGYLQVKLTRTGAVLGTPAYMAPEQFAGLGGDARTDQFSFAVALYEGLYGHRPFAGSNAIALMANVVAGTVTPPPDNTRVPTWIRRILLRGLAAAPADRFPSMTGLLDALARDPAVRRRRLLAAAAGIAAVAALGAGLYKTTAGQRAMCAGGPARFATAWGPAQRSRVERAFQATGHKAAAVAFASVAKIVDDYATHWQGMYGEACEASRVRGEQSGEVLDLRMGCLGERLSSVKALTEVFTTADTGVVENAVGAASALPTLERCADVAMLRAVVRPPDDPATRAKVAVLRDEVARVSALASAGRCDQAAGDGRKTLERAAALDYLPLKAEMLLALGRLGDVCIDAREAIGYLEEAELAAETSQHDEVAIVASVLIAGIGAGHHAQDAHTSWTWVKHGEAILRRFPGHPLLEAWTAVSRGILLRQEGRLEEALAEQRRALAAKQSLLGADHLDVTISAVNVAVGLQELGRSVEAEAILRPMLETTTRLVGPENARLAQVLMNHGETLTDLRRFDEAEAAIQRALSIWRDRNASAIYEGYGLMELGRLKLAAGAARDARGLLERAIAILGERDAEVAAEAEFALAQAMWTSPGDRRRAVERARHARVQLAARPSSDRKRQALEAWLRERGDT